MLAIIEAGCGRGGGRRGRYQPQRGDAIAMVREDVPVPAEGEEMHQPDDKSFCFGFGLFLCLMGMREAECERGGGVAGEN